MLDFNATLIFVMVSFIVFMILMRAIYFEPILKIRAEREQKLTDDQESARRFSEDFERIYAEYQLSLQNARKEAHALIQELRLKAKTSAHEITQTARADAQAESERQMGELHDWRETTYRQLESERDALTRAIIGKVTNGRKVRTATGG
jgi:F0F1-type ATP synthase membrane subunit b/b'